MEDTVSKPPSIFNKCFQYQEANLVKAAGLYPFFRPIEATCGTTVTTQKQKCVMIGSNNYLGLTHEPRVKQAAKQAIDEFGTGCTGSRFLNGNLTLHEELERKLAEFLGKEACLVFSTGFIANQGTIATLAGRQDVIFCDRENHASILEGVRSSLAQTVKFRHNDMQDLERVLKLCRHEYEGAVIIADGVFSMSGDIFKMAQARQLADAYQCALYIDDAHALGVLGPKGQGTEFHSNPPIKADIIVGTFSKSFASIGGYAAGSATVIDYIKHKCRPFIFTAALPPAATASVLKCLQIIQTEPHHVQNLRTNAQKMQRGFSELGFNTLGSTTPIVPILIGDDYQAFEFTAQLLKHGIFATPVVSPAVPAKCALIRTSYMATHTTEELDYVLNIVEMLGKQFKIIGQNSRRSQLESLAHLHFGT
jgi:8-amino-7-oxononanoate synthase